MLVDTHLHLIDQDYDIDKVIENAFSNDVGVLVVSGSDLSDNFKNVSYFSDFENVFLTVGFHPSCATCYTDDDILKLEECILNKKVVGIGEIGLDYYYGKEDADKQKELFIKQLDIAEKYSLPVVIHTRDAFLDTYNILKNYNLKGVIHCFSGSSEIAKQYIDLGYYLGIGGVVTFKNSKLRDVIKEIGISNIVLETDSPYLSPMRGEKNEPANVKLVCEFIADLLEIDYFDVADVTTNNANVLFDFYK